MKLTTLEYGDTTSAARLDGDEYVLLHGISDLSELLRTQNWREVASRDGVRIPVATARLVKLFPTPSKVICVGVNYRTHVDEMGAELPAYPTLFAKFAETLTGPTGDVTVTPLDAQIDWEGELTIVIGHGGRSISRARAADHIAGYTIANDITMRSYQSRSMQWLQGKMWEGTTPLGPCLATLDEVSPDARMRTWVDDELVQEATIDDLVFSPEELVEYISAIITLNPGDVILTGTPGGVGFARKPPRFLVDGSHTRVEIAGIGQIESRIRVA